MAEFRLRGDTFDVLVDNITSRANNIHELFKMSVEGTMVPHKPTSSIPGIIKVIYNNPATIVYWEDKTRTVVKCQPGDEYNRTIGFLMCVMKKVTGNSGKYNELLKKFVYSAATDNVDTMRKELAAFCNNKNWCAGCPLDKPDFVCGRGKWFHTDTYKDGYMTDDEIRAHYNAMKGIKW